MLLTKCKHNDDDEEEECRQSCSHGDLYLSYTQPSGQPLDSETHGGDDVGIWAVGPMSHLIHGTHQQSYIAHVRITKIITNNKTCSQKGRALTLQIDTQVTLAASCNSVYSVDRHHTD